MYSNLEITEQNLLLFYPADAKPPVVIMDFNCYYENLGAIPMHSLSANAGTIPDIIKNIATEYVKKSQNQADLISTLLTVCFLIKHSLNRYKPYKILETGCRQGMLNYFLTKTAAGIHQDSTVYCFNEIEILRDNYFDFIVINGAEFMENPAPVIKNAVRAVRPGGRLVCLTNGQYLLNSCFAVYVDGYEEYLVAEDNSVLVKIIDKNDKETLENFCSNPAYDLMLDLNAEVCRVLDNAADATADSLKTTVRKLIQMEDIAIELFAQLEDIELKYVLNRAKETVLEHIYTLDAGYKKACERRLHDYAANLKNITRYF